MYPKWGRSCAYNWGLWGAAKWSGMEWEEEEDEHVVE